MAAIAVRVGAGLLVLLAARWIYLYGLTDYRHHLVLYYLGAAVLVVAFAIALWLRVKWAVALSTAAVTLCVAASVWLMVNGASQNPVLWLAALIGLAYVGVVWSDLLRGRRSDRR